jgi:hypothetical protein
MRQSTLPKLLLFLSPFLLHADAWPQFRGPLGDGIAQTENLPYVVGHQPRLAWTAAVPAGYASPGITEELVYLMGYEEGSIPVIADGRLFVRTETKPYAFGKE